MSGTDGWVAPGADRGDDGVTGPLRAPRPPAPRTAPPPTPWAAPRGQWSPNPPATAPARPRSHGILLAVAAVVAVVVGIGAVVLTAPYAHERSAGEAVPAADEPRDSTVDVSSRGLNRFDDPAGEFEISVPNGFIPTSLRGDVAGAGSRAFPDDGGRATALDQLLASMPRSTVAVAAYTRPLGGSFSVYITVGRVDAPPGVDELDDIGLVDVPGLAPPGAEPREEPRVVELAAGDALRVEYTDLAGDSELVRWYVLAGDAIWMVTFRAGSLAEFGGFVDAVAQSFELLPPSAGRGDSDTPPADTRPTLVPVAASDGSFTARIPERWDWQLVGTDAPPLHEQLFPHFNDASGRLEQLEAELVTQQTRLVALDPDGWTVIPHRIVVIDRMSEVDPGSLGLDELVNMARLSSVEAGTGGQDEGRLSGAAGEIGSFLVFLPDGALSGVRYVVPGPSSVWLVTFWSDARAADQGIGDAIATGFTPG